MDCLQEFGQFKQVLDCSGLRQHVSLKCHWFLLYEIVDSEWFQNLCNRISLSKILQFRGYYIKNPLIAQVDEILGLSKKISAIDEAY